MKALISVLARCPYCGHHNTIANDFESFEELERDKYILKLLCDCDDGGCDKYFYAEIETIKEVRTIVTPLPKERR